MTTFTPPSIAEVPPVGLSPRGPAGRLFRYFSSRQRGVAVFKMSDGTYRIARPVTGLSVTVLEPYPATTPDMFPQTVNGTMHVAESWYAGAETDYPADSPQVSIVYDGGHSYAVSSAEAAALTAAGFGAYLS